MTLLAATSRAPDPLTEGVVDYQLTILSPDARIIERTFSYLSEAQAGLGREVTARLDPSGAGRALVFTGDPARVGCTGAEIVQFRVNDNQGWQDVFYGTITEGWASEPMNEPKTFVAKADELLEATVTDARAYGPQDPAAIASDLVKRLRHPALHYDPANFPSTGTTLEGGFEQPGITLLEALELLAKSAEGAGRTISHGIDGAGYVFFREVTGVAEILYREEDVAGFEPLPVNAEDVVTAVYWVIGNEPSVDNYSGEYSPSTLTHLSIPDSAAHDKYGRIVGRTFAGNPFKPTPAGSIEQFGFSNPERAWENDAQNNPILNTASERTAASGFPYFQIRTPLGARNRFGVAIRYRYDFDVPLQVRLRIWFTYQSVATPVTFTGIAAEYNLPYSNEEYTDAVYLVPPPTGLITRIDGTQWIPSPFLDTYAARIYNLGYTGYFALSDFRFMQLDTGLLNAAARRELRTPAREPASIRPTRDTEDGLKTYYVKPQPTVRLRQYPGEPTQAAAEYRISFNENNLVETVIDLGNPSRQGDAELIEQIRLGVEQKVRRSDVRRIGRL